MENTVTLKNFVSYHLAANDLKIAAVCKMHELKEKDYFIRCGSDNKLYKVQICGKALCICYDQWQEKHIFTRTDETIRKIEIKDIGTV